MAAKVKVLVLRTAGTNCDNETVFAFESFGAQVVNAHINELYSHAVKLNDFHIFVLPGGFSYGDDIESGKILANELRLRLGDDLCKFIGDGKLILGICNGFQILVKAGILPGPLDESDLKDHDPSQTVTLMHNDSGKFEARWVNLKVQGKSVWTNDLKESIYLPVAHGEGKFIVKDESVLEKLKQNDQIAFRYCSLNGKSPEYPMDPNGSLEHIAGITDKTGRILGLMPHPERHFLFTQHPFWTRLQNKSKFGDGAKIFENGIQYVRKNL